MYKVLATYWNGSSWVCHPIMSSEPATEKEVKITRDTPINYVFTQPIKENEQDNYLSQQLC
jgi:hypothetical protein